MLFIPKRVFMEKPTSPKQARITLGLTQPQMAIACNTTKDTVASWDQGRREPRGPSARLIELLLWLNSKNMLKSYLKIFS